MTLPRLSPLFLPLVLLFALCSAGCATLAPPPRSIVQPVYEPTRISVHHPAPSDVTVAPPAAPAVADATAPPAPAPSATIGETLLVPLPGATAPAGEAVPAAEPSAVLPRASLHPAMPVDPAALLAAEQEVDKDAESDGAAAVPGLPAPLDAAPGGVAAADAGCVILPPGEEEDVLLSADPDAVEENMVLSGEGLVPPEDEGLSAPADEVIFDFPVVENQKVQYYIDYFTGPGRKIFSRWLERTTRYLPRMQEVFAEHGLPLDLVYLSIVESGLNPRAYSCAHASGPWQFIPGTGKLFGLDSNWWLDERRDFDKATLAAALYLKELYTLFQGDWYLAVASYNAGAGKMLRAIARTGSRDFWQLARTRHIKDETKNYVPKLLATLLLARQAEKYGFVGLNYQQPLDYETVTIPTTTDLTVVARLAGSDYQTIKDLNPELKRWSTPPDVKDYQLRLPLGTAEKFLVAYAELPEAERVAYAYHKVARGDTLKSVAKRYGVGVAAIQAVNPPRKKKGLKVGSHLLIPLRADAPAIPAADLADDPVVRRPVAKVVKSHTVRKGDTLLKIARRYGVSTADLTRWNKINTKKGLRPGQVLVVKGLKKESKVIVMDNKSSRGERVAGGKSHTVQRGETLYGIARRYAVSVDQLLDWNNLPKRTVLRPGQHLTVHGKGG